ncbi:MAG: Hpt domain-containing protein, partial [Pseudoxanthomonas sp.]|nr:Hpt domain-containing protein [Pseudoxanthomonas sp.]
MLWVLSSTAAALRDGVLAASTSLRAAFAGVARAVRQAHADDQFASSDHGVASQEPTRQLLYLVAQTSETHPALDALRQAFGLDALTPSQAELDHARGSLSGRNSDLLNTVGGVVKEELLRVKDVLDLHLRTGGNAADLQPQAAELANVADTLGMLGLGVAREVVLQQRDALDAIARGEQPASESALLDIAGALLYVDASLDDQVSRLGAPGEDAGDEATAAEARRTMEVLAHEAITNFGAAREHFVAFIETNWDHERLVDVPGLLSEVSGALRILDLLPPADYLEGVRRYIATELLQRRRVPSGRQLDTLADAMASLEYYLEALRDRRPNSEQILEIARTSLENLHYWPLPDEAPAALPAEPVAVAEPAVAGFAPAAAIVIAPAASAASAWDPVAAEHDADLVAPEPEPEPQAPEAEPLEAPDLQIETPAIEPATVTAPTPLAASAGWISFDPVSAESVDSSPAEEATAAVVDVVEAGAETETEAVDAPLQVTAVGDTGQWLGSGMNAQPDLRPAQVHDGRVSHIDLDQASQSVVAEITAAAAGLATGVEATGEPQAAMPVVGGFDDAADIDADIREVFLEEFDEERDNLGRLVPHWQQAPEDLDRARPIRRVFHTLKGSGRLVGARALGEFSWKIEGMLNRVLDGSRAPSPAVLAMVEQACQILPQFDAALRGQGGVVADLHAMEAVADRIAAGEEAFYLPLAAVAPALADGQDEVSSAEPAVTPDTGFGLGPDEGTPASVDSVLREILEAEVSQHLESVDAWVAAARQAPQPASEGLLRAIHTMNGAFAMTDVPEITTVTAPAETYVRRSLATAQVPDTDGVEALAAMGAAVRTCMRALQAESPRIPGFAPLAARLGELAEGLPEASWPQPVIEADVPESEPAEAAAKDVELTASDDLGQYLGADADADAGGESLPVAADAPSTEPAFAAAAAGVVAAGALALGTDLPVAAQEGSEPEAASEAGIEAEPEAEAEAEADAEAEA